MIQQITVNFVMNSDEIYMETGVYDICGALEED